MSAMALSPMASFKIPTLPWSNAADDEKRFQRIARAVLLLVLIVELLNTAVEAAIDRVGPEWHALSKQAKDMGSAAVLLSLLLCLGTWGAALLHRFS